MQASHDAGAGRPDGTVHDAEYADAVPGSGRREGPDEHLDIVGHAVPGRRIGAEHAIRPAH